MAAIEKSSHSLCTELFVAADWRVPEVWQEVAQRTLAWLAQRQLNARDVVVLLPFAALLPPLREAFAAAGGWQPRVETTLTLSAALAPPPALVLGLCGGGTMQDRLFAARLLQAQSWAEDWAERDPLGFDALTSSLVHATQQFCSAAAQHAPLQRAGYWQQARSSLSQAGPAASGPAAAEAALLRLALDWAQQSCDNAAVATDVLYSLQPAAWVLVQLGGVDKLAEAVVRAGASTEPGSATPSLFWQLDPEASAQPLQADKPSPEPAFALSPAVGAVCVPAQVQQLLCDDFEAEAQAAAATVITALNEARCPVALVALDRALVRRVRALLDRHEVPVVDETGWHLDTTRAAGVVMALLRAAAPGAGHDAWLEWIKWAHGHCPADVDALEALWRGRRLSPQRRKQAQSLWEDAQATIAHLVRAAAQGSTHPLVDWLMWVGAALQVQARLAPVDGGPLGRSPALSTLWRESDGAQVLAALHIWPEPDAHGAVLQVALKTRTVTLVGFTQWVSTTLQDSPFLPLPDVGAQVVVTPLARVFGRHFGHTVMPGADHQHLGSVDPGPGLISDSMKRLLGLPDRTAQRAHQRLALLHSLRAGQVTFLRRQREEGEPLAQSPDVAWLALHCGAQAWPQQSWSPPLQVLSAQPVQPPQPTASRALPAVLSASALEALRQCPYRFFVRAVLRLDEPEELDAALAKRDYGTWLHAVLHRFHSLRDHASPSAPQLQEAAAWATQDLALDEGELLPFRASFERFVPAYLVWLAQREQRGWHWSDGESDHSLTMTDEGEGERDGDVEVDGGENAASLSLQLKGRIDRLDHGPDNQSQLLDYKTGSADALERKVKQPLEDTQLAFYAAVLGAGTHGAVQLRASYLALDGSDAPVEIEHPNVAASAQQLLHGLHNEWRRLQQGAPLPALGEGAVCEVCEARGLCRRDQWAVAGSL